MNYVERKLSIPVIFFMNKTIIDFYKISFFLVVVCIEFVLISVSSFCYCYSLLSYRLWNCTSSLGPVSSTFANFLRLSTPPPPSTLNPIPPQDRAKTYVELVAGGMEKKMLGKPCKTTKEDKNTYLQSSRDFVNMSCCIQSYYGI